LHCSFSCFLLNITSILYSLLWWCCAVISQYKCLTWIRVICGCLSHASALKHLLHMYNVCLITYHISLLNIVSNHTRDNSVSIVLYMCIAYCSATRVLWSELRAICCNGNLWCLSKSTLYIEYLLFSVK